MLERQGLPTTRAAFALPIATALLVVYFVSCSPNAWDSLSITASFKSEMYTTKGDAYEIIGMSLRYVVKNDTDADYTLSENTLVMIVSGETLRKANTDMYKFAESCLILAGEKVECRINVPRDFNTDFDVDGFIVFR